MTTTAPYGSWHSPISAASLVSSGHPVRGASFVSDDVWWLESRPTEEGRLAVRRRDASGEVVDVLPAPFSARTRVHEYGGGAWAVTDDGAVVFAEFSDQRLYRLDPGETTPVAITPPDEGRRFGDLAIWGEEIIAVRETNIGGEIARDIVAVSIDGSGTRSMVSGSRFLAYPRISPDGSQLAWIAWNHPNMPWDGTELRVGSIRDLEVREWRTIAGSETESVLQPEWADADHLYALSDRTGWWNLYRFGRDGTATNLAPAERDTGGPLWGLGQRWYLVLDDGRILFTSTFGTDIVSLLDPATGAITDVKLALTSIQPVAARGDRVLLLGGAARTVGGLRELDLDSGELADIRLSADDLPPGEYLPDAEARTFSSGDREVHAFVYRPRNPDFDAPEGELPPFVAIVHGGPTAHSAPTLSLATAFFTSRGIGVIDINYGGSTGYGREYRERLKGAWGIVDVEDTIAAIRGLADAGIADPKRLAIRGGSAGGWTVLAALTSSDVFACGVSYYGVADLVALAEDTHDFESRYLDGLVGPYPEAADVYRDRAPIHRVDALSCPVLLLQGMQDLVVPPTQSEAFRDAMVRRGIPHAYVTYENETHGFRTAEAIIHSTQAELSFYGQVLGFDTPDAPPLELWRP